MKNEVRKSIQHLDKIEILKKKTKLILEMKSSINQIKKRHGSWVPVAHAFNPTYLGG
jgi:hypothetical protein